jgi:hypothetical protein
MLENHMRTHTGKKLHFYRPVKTGKKLQFYRPVKSGKKLNFTGQ